MWERLVRDDETIVHLGGPEAQVGLWRRVGTMSRYDQEFRRDWRLEGSYAAVVWNTDPPLVLSHQPILPLPPGAINLHDRRDRGTAPAPTRRHVALGYAAKRLSQVLVE